MNETTYEFRELNSTDIFPIASLINKIGINKIKNAFSENGVIEELSKKDRNLEAIGMSVVFEMAQIVLAALPVCKDDIYNILASVSNLSKEELEKMNMGKFFEMIIDFIKKPEFSDFMKVVSKLFK